VSLFVLDTDTLSLLHHGNPAVLAKATSHEPSDLSVTIITVEEQLTGWYTMLRRAASPGALAGVYKRLTTLVSRLANAQILSFDEPAISRYQTLVGLKLNVGRYDLRIAAIVMEHPDAVLVMRNTRDFSRIPGLRLVNWADEIA
jgi:tRNA(fMet)-specific endonuclease VapC